MQQHVLRVAASIHLKPGLSPRSVSNKSSVNLIDAGDQMSRFFFSHTLCGR
jgi:hypothetical protein